MRFRTLAAVLLIVVVVPFAWQAIAARQGTNVSLVIANGIVITVDGTRRILNPGSIAINGSEIVGVGTPERDRRAVQGARDHRRHGQGRDARA